MGVPASAIDLWRSRWAERFIDTVTVTRMTGRGTFNETTLQYTSGSQSTIYTGGALVRPMQTRDIVQFGERQVTLEDLVVYLPWDTAAIQPEDVIAGSAAIYDPTIASFVAVVVATHHDSWLTRRKVAARLNQGTGYGDSG